MDTNNCCCCDTEFEIHKNVVSLYKMTIPGAKFNRMVATLEIILINNSCNTINNISVKDSIFGIGLNDPDRDLLIHATVTSCCDTIIPNDEATIFATCGELVNPLRSSLGPCSVCVILAEISVMPNNIFEIDLPYLLSTTIISGTVNNNTCGMCKAPCKLLPKVIKTEVFKGESNILFALDVFFPGSCSIQCFPYTNRRCRQVTCPTRPRPR